MLSEQFVTYILFLVILIIAIFCCHSIVHYFKFMMKLEFEREIEKDRNEHQIKLMEINNNKDLEILRIKNQHELDKMVRES